MNITRWLSAVFILSVVIVGLGFIKFGQIQAAIAFAESFPEPSAAVKSTYATTSQYAKTAKVIGQVTATKTLDISNEYAGIITFVGFKPGDVVEQDQVLLRIDSSLEKADLAAASARLKLANKTHQRVTKLVKQNRISQDEVDKAEADVSIAQAEIDNLTTVINKKVIRAPFNGRVDLTQYQVGQLLNANSQITYLVGIDDEIWVDFSVPQTLPQPSINEQVEISVATTSEQLSNSLATVIAKHSSVDANSRQQSYRASLKNLDGKLVHNQIVSVYTPIENSHVVLVPTNAVTRNHFGNYVYLLEQDENKNWRTKSVKVTLGDKVKNQQVILTGLTGNELIASEGAFKLTENMLVYTQLPAQTMSQVGGN